MLLSIKPSNPNADTPVFKAPKGGLIDAHNFLNRAWKTVLSELNIPYRPQYHTRHTFITNCLEAGVSVVQVAKWVGNSLLDNHETLRRFNKTGSSTRILTPLTIQAITGDTKTSLLSLLFCLLNSVKSNYLYCK